MTSARMSAKEALVAVHRTRRDEDIVITTMSPARDWMTLPQHSRDLVLVPSAMSHGTSIGLGLALAQPKRRVIVCNGDGSMLMNLGSLVSIVAAGTPNLVVLVFENGTYEVTGSQHVPGADVVDYAGIARSTGFESVFEFSDLGEWQREVGAVLRVDGPTFAVLHVAPVYGIPGPKSPGPAGERAGRFAEALR
jgi:sulfopyruvate decarboxylase subunit beta